MKTGQNILLISPEAWGTNMLSKHHYATFLSENHLVCFLNPAAGFTTLPFGNMKISMHTVKPGLIVLNYLNLLPKLNLWPMFIQSMVYSVQAKRIKKKIGLNIDIVWSFDPRRFSDLRKWKAAKRIYHSVDFHPDCNEKKVIETSNLVVGVSEIICTQLKNLGAHPLQVNHGSSLTLNSKINLVQLPGKNKIKAIYTGNFHLHVDYTLLLKLADENSDCDFILVGPIAPSNISSTEIDANQLLKIKARLNIHLIGEIPGERLIDYLSSADICLVLFKKEFELIHHAPHKLMAYFASGKIILSTFLDAYKTLDGDLITMVDRENYDEIFREVKSNLAHHNSTNLATKRMQYAAENHYRIKIQSIFEKLEK